VTSNKWYWQGLGTGKLALTSDHTLAVQGLIYNYGSEACMAYKAVLGNNGKPKSYFWGDDSCTNAYTYQVVCEFDGQGLTPVGKPGLL
jgi:hypothetical protein